MSTFFLVWYVLSVTTVQDGKLVNFVGIKTDLQTCQHDAARAVAADANVRWACHEMTTEGRPDKSLYVAFPNN